MQDFSLGFLSVEGGWVYVHYYYTVFQRYRDEGESVVVLSQTRGSLEFKGAEKSTAWLYVLAGRHKEKP